MILFAAYVGLPGAAVGAIGGALAWRAHRVWGAVVGAVLGDGLWAWIYLAFL